MPIEPRLAICVTCGTTFQTHSRLGRYPRNCPECEARPKERPKCRCCKVTRAPAGHVYCPACAAFLELRVGQLPVRVSAFTPGQLAFLRSIVAENVVQAPRSQAKVPRTKSST